MDGEVTCDRCDGLGEVYGFTGSVSPFSGVRVNDPQCVESGVCPRCDGEGVVVLFDPDRVPVVPVGEPLDTDITLADTLSDEDLDRYLADPDGFLADLEDAA